MSFVARSLTLNKLDDLENEASIILCQLEMYFSPSFFYIMIHLIVHLVREIRLCGPIFLRWMYLVEHYMKMLKGYTRINIGQRQELLKDTLLKKLLGFDQSICKPLHQSRFLKVDMTTHGKVGVHEDSMLQPWIVSSCHKLIYMY